jgi:hypothetical protein
MGPGPGRIGLFALLLALGGCGDRLRPGFCEKPEDCSPGELCDLEGRTAFRRCLPVNDGGRADGRSEAGPPLPAGNDGGPDDGPPDPGAPDGPASCGQEICPAEKPVCLGSACVECTRDGHCTDPTRPFCAANACVDCRMAAAGACGPDRVCNPMTGACAECLEAAHCKNPAKSFCTNQVCVGCQDAAPGTCKAPTAVCDAASGTCVECTVNSTCTEARAPFCSGNRCVGCGMAAPQTCAMLAAARPVCAADGACVECSTSADCPADGKPICLDRACAGCTTDAQCAMKLGPNPGVCLRHLGGRCATEAETIYVKRDTSCGPAGTSAVPLCGLEPALPLVTATRNLIVVRGLVEGFEWSTPPAAPVSIVGQGGAVLAGGIRSGVRLSGAASVYLRNVAVSSSELPGIWADQGATLRLESVVVDRNRGGGILLQGARFDLRDVRITGNGIGETGAVIWGGILVQEVPGGGPARLERVSIIGNLQSGLACDAPIEGVGVHARGNLGGVDVAARCGVTVCGTENATCGSSVTLP